MALLPKTTPVAPTAPASATRTGVPVSRVASLATSQIDALNDGTNISFDTAASEYQAQQEHSNLYKDGGNSRRDRQAELGLTRLFSADSQVYAAILEQPDTVAAPSTKRFGAEQPAARATETPVNRVITTYETNALVISGQQPVRGTSFSLSL